MVILPLYNVFSFTHRMKDSSNSKKNRANTLEGRAFVKKGNSWRLTDSKGQVLKKFGDINAFQLLSVLVVKENGLYGLIDLTGERALPCEYRNIAQPFHSSGSSGKVHDVLELVDQNDRLWLADRNGKIVTSRSYKGIATGSYSHDQHVYETWNGMADLYDSDEQGNHQKSGLFDMINVREIIPAIYEPGVPDYCDFMGVYAVGIPVFHCEDGIKRCKLINAQGEELIPFEKGFSSIGIPHKFDYLIEAEKDGKWGYVNIEGAEKIPFKYDYAESFWEGFAIVGYNDTDGTGAHYGVIGHHNRIVIPFMFRFPPQLELTDDGLAASGCDKDYQEVSYTWKVK